MKKEYSVLHLPVTKEEELAAGTLRLVSLGKRSLKAIIEPEYTDPSDYGTVLLSGLLARQLGLPGSMRLNARFNRGVLRVGPLVGILASNFKREKRSFGSQDRYFRSLISKMKALNGLAFVFSHPDVDTRRKLIHGYYLPASGEGPWHRNWFPFPDVYYNRYFKGANQLRSKDLAASLSRYGVKAFNTGVGNKWQVFRLLSRERDIISHLPETRLLVSPQSLNSLLSKHQGVYVKPVNGCKGRSISRVIRRQGRFLIRNSQEVQSKQLASLPEVYSCFRGGNETMVVQQAIKAPAGQSHFDIRVMVQKDRYNQWDVTGIVARVGGNGQVTTNLHTGGQAAKLETVLESRGIEHTEIKHIVREIKRLGVRIAETLDRRSSTLGDLGMDFVIDERGKVWFLEVNPKPGRRSFSSIGDETRRLVVSRPMEYACYLAGF